MSTPSPWTIGQPATITWQTQDYLDPDLVPLPNVKIRLQRDGGVWETISPIANAPNTGTYTLAAVTAGVTSNAILEISDPLYGVAIGYSTAFAIQLPAGGGVDHIFERCIERAINRSIETLCPV